MESSSFSSSYVPPVLGGGGAAVIVLDNTSPNLYIATVQSLLRCQRWTLSTKIYAVYLNFRENYNNLPNLRLGTQIPDLTEYHEVQAQ